MPVTVKILPGNPGSRVCSGMMALGFEREICLYQPSQALISSLGTVGY